MPQTERNDILKMYGDAPETVSVSIVTVDPEALGFAFKLAGKLDSRYVNEVLSMTDCTFVEILKGCSTTPLILIGVPALKLCSVSVVTVTILLGVVPLPEIIELILIGSDAKAPTISHSELFFAKPSGFAGNLSRISR